MIVLFRKLKHLRKVLSNWNNEYFGNIFKKVQITKQNMSEAEREVKHSLPDDALLKLYKAWNELQNQHAIEEKLWI